MIQLTSVMVTQLMGNKLTDWTSHAALKMTRQSESKNTAILLEFHIVLLAWRSNSTFNSLIDLSAVAAGVGVEINIQSQLSDFIKRSRFCSVRAKDVTPVSLEKNTRDRAQYLQKQRGSSL